jgi:hypothetical protein
MFVYESPGTGLMQQTGKADKAPYSRGALLAFFRSVLSQIGK